MRAALAATLVMTTALLSGTAARAPAADLAAANPKMVVKTPPPPAPLSGWSGWYVGANAGGDWGRSRSTTTVGGSALNPSFAPFALTVFNAIGSPAAFNTHGFTGGVHGGYNYVSGQWLVGVEGDLEAFRSAGSTSATGALFTPTTGSVPVTLTSAMSTDWLLTVRPRAGIVVNDWLVFATGGLAVTQLRPSWTTAVVVQTEQATASSIKAGWVVGGGVERMLPGRWTLGVEYLYVSFPSATAVGFATDPTLGTITNPFTHSANLAANIVRARISKLF